MTNEKPSDARFRFLRIQTDPLPKFSIRSGANRSRVRRRGSASLTSGGSFRATVGIAGSPIACRGDLL